MDISAMAHVPTIVSSFWEEQKLGAFLSFSRDIAIYVPRGQNSYPPQLSEHAVQSCKLLQRRVHQVQLMPASVPVYCHQ